MFKDVRLELLQADFALLNVFADAAVPGAVTVLDEGVEAAVGYYRATLAAQPRTPVVRYFANNNLGYSLNQLGRFVEGEACCRAAREVLPELPNAHKNLGLALAGQGRWREAAESYLEGTRVAPRDRRSYDLLERLLRDHPELAAEFAAAARAARDAVSGARAWTN